MPPPIPLPDIQMGNSSMVSSAWRRGLRAADRSCGGGLPV